MVEIGDRVGHVDGSTAYQLVYHALLIAVRSRVIRTMSVALLLNNN